MVKENSTLSVICFFSISFIFPLIPIHQLLLPPPPLPLASLPPFHVSHPYGSGLIQEAEVTVSAKFRMPHIMCLLSTVLISRPKLTTGSDWAPGF